MMTSTDRIHFFTMIELAKHQLPPTDVELIYKMARESGVLKAGEHDPVEADAAWDPNVDGPNQDLMKEQLAKSRWEDTVDSGIVARFHMYAEIAFSGLIRRGDSAVPYLTPEEMAKKAFNYAAAMLEEGAGREMELRLALKAKGGAK